MDDGHLIPYITGLKETLAKEEFSISEDHLVIQNGRVRAGYASGEILFGQSSSSSTGHGIVHIIGERPGSGHHNFSAYLTVAKSSIWHTKGTVDHNISRVVSGISDTALHPQHAIRDTIENLLELFSLYG